jgi:peptidoglycan/xylan/chitin deacetylase (PgdA/CDA1 family)
MPLHFIRVSRFFCLVAFTFCTVASATPPPASVITLMPAASVGGTVVTAPDGREAVSLPASTPPTKGHAWTLSTPLAPGWWEASVEFVVLPKDSLRFQFIIGSAFKPVFDVSETDLPGNTPTARFRFCNVTPVTSFAVRPQRLMADTVRAITRVTLTSVTGPSSPSDFALVEVPVNATGIATLPPALPTGNWQIIPHFTEGKSPLNGSLVITTAQGAPFTVPATDAINLFASSPFKSLTWTPAIPKLDGAVLRYLPPYRATFPTASKRTILPAFSPDQFTRITLTLAGNATALPSLPLFPRNAKFAIVTSWDDSPIREDLRTAALLEKYGFPSTFFISREGHTNEAYVKELETRNMEVASHTLNHPRGWMLAPSAWATECLHSRTQLEAIVGHPVISFAYPYNYVRADDAAGDFVLRAVREAGFFSARTTRTGSNSIDSQIDPLLLPTDGYYKNNGAVLARNWTRIREGATGGIFYFWGHAWDNRTEEDWKNLEALLTTYAHQPDTWYATQGQLSLWRWLRTQARWENPRRVGPSAQITLTYPKLDPWLQKQVPVSISIPTGVTQVSLADGKTLPIENGLVTLPAEVF